MKTYYLLFESHYWTRGENSNETYKDFLDCYEEKYDAEFEISDRITQHAGDSGIMRIEITNDGEAIYYRDGEVIEWTIFKVDDETDHMKKLFDIYIINKKDHEEDLLTECFDYAMNNLDNDPREMTANYMRDLGNAIEHGWEKFVNSGVFHDCCGRLEYCNDEIALTRIDY